MGNIFDMCYSAPGCIPHWELLIVTSSPYCHCTDNWNHTVCNTTVPHSGTHTELFCPHTSSLLSRVRAFNWLTQQKEKIWALVHIWNNSTNLLRQIMTLYTEHQPPLCYMILQRSSWCTEETAKVQDRSERTHTNSTSNTCLFHHSACKKRITGSTFMERSDQQLIEMNPH